MVFVNSVGLKLQITLETYISSKEGIFENTTYYISFSLKLTLYVDD